MEKKFISSLIIILGGNFDKILHTMSPKIIYNLEQVSSGDILVYLVRLFFKVE